MGPPYFNRGLAFLKNHRIGWIKIFFQKWRKVEGGRPYKEVSIAFHLECMGFVAEMLLHYQVFHLEDLFFF